MYILKEYIYIDGQLDDVDVSISESKESLVKYISSEVGEDVWDWFRSSNSYKDYYHNKIYKIEEQ